MREGTCSQITQTPAEVFLNNQPLVRAVQVYLSERTRSCFSNKSKYH